MYVKYAGEGRLRICFQAIAVGADLCVIISGGTKPHIGCGTLSIPRSSLADPNVMSATTSVFNRVGHKDDSVANYVSHVLASALNTHVVVACGIHVAAITPDEILLIQNLVSGLVKAYVDEVKQAE